LVTFADMRPLPEAEIRTSFVNCSKGEASRIRMPAGLSRTPWADLDFLGWTDPGVPLRTPARSTCGVNDSHAGGWSSTRRPSPSARRSTARWLT
jgi:hypothetical protein